QNNKDDQSTPPHTKRPYKPLPNLSEPLLEAGGDGDFESAKNYYNKQACMEGDEWFVKRYLSGF
ncbi:MAG: hypothetical protein PSV35_03760, partial [bacterium]|nr:hypothetical protein [bacterium]